jgi:peptidoglycan/xylan/chitin deacetylase (PgdA/CDA1 family)
MTKLTVLMYHAVTDSGGECSGADPHYAVTRSTFRMHLALVRDSGFLVSSVAGILASGPEGGKIAFTFDDGHESNAAAAADILEHGGSADFFVNPAMVGQRNYLDWQALEDLAENGISIQSHGDTHRYFDDLSETEIERELYDSKSRIEEKLARRVTLFAPPGGRMNVAVATIAKRLGYHGICSSRAGIWRAEASTWQIPRFAILASTSDDQFRRWIGQDAWEVARIMSRDRVLQGAKRLLGNRRYEQLRSRLISPSGETGTPS